MPSSRNKKDVTRMRGTGAQPRPGSLNKFRKPRGFFDEFDYALRFYEAINTPKSLACAILLRNREIGQLVNLECQARSYDDPVSFYRDYQCVSLLKKFPFGKIRDLEHPKSVAIKKFIEAEHQCAETNQRFRDRQLRGSSPRVERILFSAQRKIAAILGDVPSFESLEFRFGPGAAYGVRGHTSPYNKLTANLECTYAMVPILSEFLSEFPGWIQPDSIVDIHLREGSELTFVPKNAKTDRPICIEPLLNGLYQKGVGSYIRARLKRFGVNLNDQTVNQKLASVAGRLGLSTVDFSSASDTIAYGLVLDLLPFDWFEFLDVARCSSYEYEGVVRHFHKFSSMGNAYTFELETLIFYALACASCEEAGIEFRTGENLHVYGDDVIIPRDAFDVFQDISSYCGFTINEDKSFRDGRFFESCGCDYFDGILVRPFFLKKRLNKLLPAFYAINTIRRFEVRLRLACWEVLRTSHKRGLSLDLDPLHNLFDWCVGRLPRRFRVLGPEGYGDGHIICELDESRASRHRQFDGWVYHSYREKSIRVKSDWPTSYALYSAMVLPDRRIVNASDGQLSLSDNSEGYAVRNRTQLIRGTSLCHGSWTGPYTSVGLIACESDLLRPLSE